MGYQRNRFLPGAATARLAPHIIGVIVAVDPRLRGSMPSQMQVVGIIDKDVDPISEDIVITPGFRPFRRGDKRVFRGRPDQGNRATYIL